jgi:4-hydroxythreonine-4-phosphate dehydrogenase
MVRKKSLPNIGITMGDPSGIGPEIIAKALQQPQINSLAQFYIFGNADIFKSYAHRQIKKTTLLHIESDVKQYPIGTINKQSGQASLLYLDTALAKLKEKNISSLVTGPICKEAVQLSDPHFCGHTEYLAKYFHTKEFDMMFVLDQIKMVVVTRHIPLKNVSDHLTKQSIYQTLCLTGRSLQHMFKIKNPRIAVCGLNPHAGEGGGIGREEQKLIIPAIKQASTYFKFIDGPLAADTLFCSHMIKKYDAVITMYHDQGLVALKAMSFDKLVNLTIGLPIIRTSPAHGTAFDIAGKNKANPSSMISAITLAARLSS